MNIRRLYVAARDSALIFAAILLLTGCAGGVSGPCDDSDPVGPCATSHSQVRGG